MSARTRALLAVAAVCAVVVVTVRALRPTVSATPVVATFESTLNGESVRRGAFERGEHVQTPAGGRVEVLAPDGGRVIVEENSLITFITLAPLAVDVARGRVSVRSGDQALTVRHAGRVVRVGSEADLTLDTSPPELEVRAGAVTLDGERVSGRRALPVP
ncbi:MAG: hypothetical protein R3B40_16300 [Polyangiales bacterium]|nr:hypothetical protein [Sandaracinaceae bacterium]